MRPELEDNVGSVSNQHDNAASSRQMERGDRGSHGLFCGEREEQWQQVTQQSQQQHQRVHISLSLRKHQTSELALIE